MSGDANAGSLWQVLGRAMLGWESGSSREHKARPVEGRPSSVFLFPIRTHVGLDE